MAAKVKKDLMVTIETRLDLDIEKLSSLRKVNEFCSQVKHKVFVRLHGRGEEVNLVKRETLEELGISGRHYNSIKNQLDGQVASWFEGQKNRIDQLKGAISALEKKLKRLTKDIDQRGSLIKAIDSHKQAVKDAKDSGKKKLKMPIKIRGKHRCQLVCDIQRLSFTKHQKHRSLARKKHCLEQLKQPRTPKVCFGGRKLFHAQHHLEANGYETHSEWLADWRSKRASQSYWLGTCRETLRNLNAQYHPHLKTLQLRMPEALEAVLGSHLVLENVQFGKHQKAIEEAILGTEKAPKRAVSYRILECQRRGGKTRFYLQASFKPVPAEIQTSRDLGVIGVDMNADYLAVCETDRFGNPVRAFSLPYRLTDKSSAQAAAILGDYCADITDLALAKGKPIAIEELDFQKKKARLREEGGKRYRTMLSSFCYKKFHHLTEAQCQRKGVKLYEENAAFTSVIGFEKFQGFTSLSTHEMAALALARRAQRLSERPKVHGTRSGAASIRRVHRANDRHVWQYWRRNTRQIRSQISQENQGKTPTSLASPRRLSGFFESLRLRCDYRKDRRPLLAQLRSCMFLPEECRERQLCQESALFGLRFAQIVTSLSK